MDVLKELSLAGIVPVIQVEDAQDAVPLCGALKDGGLPVAEITFRSSAAAQAIALVHERMPDIILGAGTVLTPEQVDSAVNAGASYIVSPGLNPRTVRRCQEHGIPIVPGCATASEIELAIELGLHVVKFFPAEAIGGPAAIKALSGPFRQLRFLPTGGIGEHNLLDYLSLSAVIACGGSWMVPKEAIAAKDWDRIERLTREAVALMHGFELRHIGINSGSDSQAVADAQALARMFGFPIRQQGEVSYFAGDAFELMRVQGRGEKGHIAIACNDVDRAIWHLQRLGLSVDDSTRRQQGDSTEFVYLDQEIAGFALHLIKK